MATGENPWARQNIGNNIEDLFKLCDKFGQPDIPDFLSDACKDFISQCLTIDYRDRPSTEVLLNHEFLQSN